MERKANALTSAFSRAGRASYLPGGQLRLSKQ
nr:MAG TPA_asm: hypothetical protein [Caudoviricetes sp.]